MLKAKKNVTIADIAKATGYSKTAVSFAFNRPERIGQDAREAILAAADKLGYIPDPSARNLSLGKRQAIGFLLPQDIDISLGNPYMVDVLRGAGKACQEAGYSLSLIPPVNDSLTEAVKRATVDGIITMGYLMGEGVGEVAETRGLHIVMVDGGGDSYPNVGIDDKAAARSQLSKVLGMGHRKIALVSLPAPVLRPDSGPMSIAGKRLAGYGEALAAFSLAPGSPGISFRSAEATFEAGAAMAEEIANEGATCVVAMSDIQAFGILSGFGELGVRVPEDVSVVGFDNIRTVGWRKLTTIAQPGYEKGLIAGSCLISAISGEVPPAATLVDYCLVEGDTLAAPRG